MTFQPTLEELVEYLNNLSENQLIDLIKSFQRLSDRFAFFPFQREVFHSIHLSNNYSTVDHYLVVSFDYTQSSFEG